MSILRDTLSKNAPNRAHIFIQRAALERTLLFFSTELVAWREVGGTLQRVLLLQTLQPQSDVQVHGDVNHLVLSPLLQVAAYWKQVQQR